LIIELDGLSIHLTIPQLCHKGIERMHLVAHSLSGIFAVAYAEKYPEVKLLK
jgi:pimeloyl-ACP methyl ester carboxylesterase